MFKIPENQQYIISALESEGFEAYIVGGCVRDMALGKIPNDFDVTTSALPEDIMRIFPKTVPTGIKHGTVTVIISGEPIEVTTFRTESGYTDSRRPDKVRFVSNLKEDLSRRDFTVNAMAYNNSKGLIDLFGGMADLEKKILRAVGDSELRFTEDALRILRLFRFASQLSFNIEYNTLKSALKKQAGLEKISRERIFTELYKAVSGHSPRALAPLIENGGLEFLGIKNLPDFDIIKKCKKSENLPFFAFLNHSSTEPLKVLDELKASNSLKNYCATLKVLTDLPFPDTKAEIKEMLNISSPDIFGGFLIFSKARGKETQKAETLLKEITENNEPYKISHLRIDGEALKALGFSGKEIGEKLEALRRFVVENPDKNNKKSLYNAVFKV